MAAFCITRGIDGEAVIETQWPNRQIKPQPDTEIRSEAVERSTRARQGPGQHCSRRRMKSIIKLGRDRVNSSRYLDCPGSEIQRVRIDEAAIVKNCAACFLDDRESELNRRARHRLAANRLIV